MFTRSTELAGIAPVLACALLVGACEREQQAAPSASATSEPASQDFAKLTPAQRRQRVEAECYVVDSCKPARTAALLAAAETATEKQALAKAGRAALAAQVQTKLAKKHNQVVKVKATQTDVVIDGVCNKFVIQNFVDGPGAHARHLGVERVECKKQGLKASAEL